MAKLGMNAKLYYAVALLTDNEAADAEGADWQEVSNVRDVTLNLDTGEADITTRANEGWKQTAQTLKDASVEFEMIWDTGDAAFEAMKDSYMDRTPIALAVMSGDIETNDEEGLVSNFSVTSFNRTEPLEDAIKVAVTVKPYDQTQWYKVGASS